MATKQKPHPQSCERCPHRFSDAGCPAWITKEMGFAYKNTETHELRLIEGCFYPLMLRMMYDMAKNVDGAASSVQMTRNAILRGFQRLVELPTVPGGNSSGQILTHRSNGELSNDD